LQNNIVYLCHSHDMSDFPDLNAIVPPVTLILPEAEAPATPGKADITQLKQQRQVGAEQIDIRLPIVHEFLRAYSHDFGTLFSLTSAPYSQATSAGENHRVGQG
jgi:hypothetical protein